MRFPAPTATEARGALIAGLIVIEVLLVCYICLQVYMLGRPSKRRRGTISPADAAARPAHHPKSAFGGHHTV